MVPQSSVVAADRSAKVVATSVANVRSCARLDCTVIGTANLGDVVTNTGNMTNGFWPVRWNGKTGYVFSELLDRGQDDPWFRQGDVSCNRVALIFNIGIGNTPSQSILKTLTTNKVPTTMFAMGWWAKKFPAYLLQMNAAGFEIGTHGDQRMTLPGQSSANVRKDVSNSVTAIESVIGRPIDEYFTPYAAETNVSVRRSVAQLGLLPIGWGVAAADYGPEATEQYVYSRVMNGIYPGAIVEMHLDGPATEQSTARALPRIIKDLRAQGYTLSSVSDLMKACSPPVAPSSWPTSGTATAEVRCRANPSTSGAILTTLGSGMKVTIRGKAFRGWWPVSCAGSAGWVSGDYLRTATTTPTTPTPTPPPTGTRYARVAGTGGLGVNCRASGSTSGAVIVTLGEGTRVPLRGSSVNGWYPVTCNGKNGWVSGDYLRLE